MLPAEIRNTYNSVAAECFSATNLINQFDTFQECYPEEIWRLDIQRKYIRTFTGNSVDNSKPKHDIQYLRDMMQGRKKYQRRQWVRDQEIYFGTMNLMNTVVGDNNRIIFRCYTPTGNDIVVPPDYTLRITPYSDMYVSVMFGNGGVQQVRAKAGTEYTIECPLSSMDDTQVTIYGANRIQALSDLSACYIAANNFSMATKLRKLVLGNTTQGYNNARLVSLTIGANELLEELDIRNCGNLTGSINLSRCSNLLKLYAEGTKITGAIFATNGKVQIAHLPSTVNILTMRNLNNMVDFQATLNRLETLTLQGGVLDNKAIVEGSINTLQTLYLYDIDWTLPDTTLMNQMLNLFYSMVTGEVYISGSIRNQEILNYSTAWPDLIVGYDAGNLVTQYLLTYVNADANNTVLYRMYIDRGSTPPDPYAEGWIQKPTLDSTPQYTYEFGTYTNGVYDSGSGWYDITTSVLSGRTITAVYTSTVRTYPVTWYSRPGLPLKSVNAEFGTAVDYDLGIPINTEEESSYVYNVFKGWNNSTGYIRGNTDVYAIWDRAELPPVGTEMKDMSIAQLYGVGVSGRASTYFEEKDYYDITMGADFNFSNVDSQVLLQDRYFDGATYVDTDIKLFDANADNFTLAIDFEFSEAITDGTLVSCFEEEGTEGVRLRYSAGPNIQWGDKNTSVGQSYQRGMVVLRHLKGSDKLFVYASNVTYGDQFADAISRIELTRTRSTDTESVLSFGAVRFLGDGGHDLYGKGWIHWCKIWFDDLGDANCRQLASWPHETWRMEYYGASRYRQVGNTSARSNLSFVCNHALSMGYYMSNSSAGDTNYGDAVMRTFLNGRIYNAYPVDWRSIMKKVRINSAQSDQNADVVMSEDYVFLPAYAEVSGAAYAPYVNEGSLISFFTNSRSMYKFKNIIIPEDSTFYNTEADPTTLSNYDVKDGDIWVGSATSGRGSIYVSATNAAKHNYAGMYNDVVNAADGGIWVIARSWWERSCYPGITGYYYVVDQQGNVGSIGYSRTIYDIVHCISI